MQLCRAAWQLPRCEKQLRNKHVVLLCGCYSNVSDTVHVSLHFNAGYATHLASVLCDQCDVCLFFFQPVQLRPQGSNVAICRLHGAAVHHMMCAICCCR